eukprot:1159519-Pelagomonas_calceolata.AAC.9
MGATVLAGCSRGPCCACARMLAVEATIAGQGSAGMEGRGAQAHEPCCGGGMCWVRQCRGGRQKHAGI